MNWSANQTSIFDFVASDNRSAVINAVAGSGKTTTIVEAVKKTPFNAYVAFVAFNKIIAEEIGRRLPNDRPSVSAMTLNSMGFRALNRVIKGRPKIDTRKMSGLLYDICGFEHKRYVAPASRLCALAKSIGMSAAGYDGLNADTADKWDELLAYHNIDLPDKISFDQLVDYCRKAMSEGVKQRERIIDFDDQLYLPVLLGATFSKFDFVFLDEAQDINHIQREMVKRSLKPKGRLIAVGDRAQAIYGFRGADSASIDNITAEFDAVELPLTVSYRCPKKVVEYAKQFAPQIEAHSDAPDGEIKTYDMWNESVFGPNDIVVCRNTAPLVKAAYLLIRRRVGCRVLGREIGQGLVTVIDKMSVRNDDIEGLRERLSQYQKREGAALLSRGREQQVAALNDKVETIDVFIDELPEDDRTLTTLKTNIGSLFSDETRGSLVRLMTGHKAKGLEADRVFILNWRLCPSKYAKQDWQKQQEANLQYVMVTRAKQTLIFIDDEDYNEKEVKEAA
jgi:superfamily I DNA/RNA helicase